jgi:hypothetical protein
MTPPRKEEVPRSSSAGKMTVIGLDLIKQRLAERWDKVSASVHRYFETALQRQMRPGDTFHKMDDLSFVVIFRDLSAAEAQVKCVAVGEEICRYFFGEDKGEISVRALVGEVEDRFLLPGGISAAAIDQSLEASGAETIINEHGVAPAPPQASSPEAAGRQLNLAFGPNFERPVPIPQSQIGFVYRPLWDAFRQVVLMYLCQPVPPRARDHTLCMAPNHEDDRLELDMMCLKEAANRIASLRRAGVRLLVACPIHFSTIARSPHWAEYSRLYHKVPAALARDLAFVVLGIDHGIPNTRLAQEVPKLSAGAKAVFAAVDHNDRQLGRFRSAGFQALGMELERPDKGERGLIDAINVFTREVGALGMESFVLGAQTTSTVVNAVAAGVRYLEGKSVWPAVAEPRHAFVHEMGDIYRDVVAL